MLKYEVTHRLSTAYHPQTSGQVEVSNRGLKRILLWAFRIAYKTPIGCTPYKLVYGKACHLSIELEHKAYWALKQANFDLTVTGDHQKIQLNELNEIRDHAYENSLIYKEKTKRIHDSKIKNNIFNVGDRVLFFNSRLKIFSGKLKTRWSGPFTIVKVFPYGTVELSQANGPNFKVNGHRVKHYFEGDVPQLETDTQGKYKIKAKNDKTKHKVKKIKKDKVIRSRKSKVKAKGFSVGNKMHKAFPLPVMEFPLSEEVPTASEESSHCQKKRDATVVKIRTATKRLMHRIVWRNRSDLDTMSLDDLYNHLKVYESKVQKKSKSNSQNKAFISSAKHSSGNEEVNIASVSTDSTNVSTASANIRVASISQDTACAYIASQSSGSQIKFEDINQIDEDDMEEMKFKWNMALLSMRADRLWKKTGKKISIQGTDVAGFDKLKVKCFNCHKMGHFARECRAPRSQDRKRRDNYKQGSKVEEYAPKALMAIDEVGWDWSYMANDKENHALVADEEDPTEFALMAKTSAESKVFDNSLCSKACKKNTDSLNSKITNLDDKLGDAKNMIYHYKLGLAQIKARLVEHRNQEVKYCEKIRVLEFKTESRANCIKTLTKDLELLKKEKGKLETKLTSFQTASKDLDSLLKSQRLDKNKEGLGYSAIPPLPAQVYSPPKKDLSWTGLLKFADDTVTNYSRPAPNIESSLYDAQNRNPSVTVTKASPSTISPKSFIKFVKATDRSTETKTAKVETAKPTVKYVAVSHNNIDDKGYWDSGCSRHMTVNISYLSDYELFDGGYVSFGQGGCKITGKGTIKTGKLEFENVYFVKDLKTPKQHNMYSIDLNNIVPHQDLTCLVAKDSADECMLWHRRLGHLNFKTMNKLIRHNLVRGLPTECFENDHTCTACLKGKQHKASWKFEAKGDEGYFIGYSMSSKAFRVINKRTKRVEENLHVDFLENKAIGKGTNSTNFSGTKDSVGQEVKKDVSSLRYIALPNWVYDALLESSSSKPHDDCSTDGPESSENSNPTATSTNPLADQMETLTVETPIPTVSSPVLTACFTDSQEPSSDTRLISKRVANQVETPSLDNILTLTNQFEDILEVTTNLDESNGVEADVSNMKTTITSSPTPTLRIHKDHPKSQIIGPVDTLIQTRHKSKEVGEQSFIATIHQKTDPALL
nr:reverse transcriptase domain-containing protein [Tanacetum cinerariifolium]